MSAQEITARVGTDEDAPSATVVYDFGDNVDEASEKFGGDVVFGRFKAASVVDVQALIRRHLSGETVKTEEEIQAIVEDWRPGVSTRTRKSAKQKAEEAFDALSDADRSDLLDSLTS